MTKPWRYGLNSAFVICPVFSQHRSTSATLQAWAMQPPAVCGSRAFERYADHGDAVS